MAITFCPEGTAATYNINYVWRQTSGVFSANLVGTYFSFFDVGATTNDAIYFGWDDAKYYNGTSWARLRLDIVTGITGTGLTGVWEYYSSQYSTWFLISEACTLNDDTAGLTTTGVNLVRFGRLPFMSYTGISVNGQRLGWVVRYRLTGGTITNGGQHNNVAPRTYDGTIRISGYPASSPATMDDVYTAMTTNFPEVGMKRLTDGASQYYGEAYEIPNAGFYLNNTDSYLHTENCLIKMGNGSPWYAPTIGGTWTDGLRFGDFGTNGSRFIHCWFSGTSWFNAQSTTALYGTNFTPGRYHRVMAGVLRQGGIGSGYFGRGNGTYVSINNYNMGEGYWTGTGTILNSTLIYSTTNVTYPFTQNYVVSGLNIATISSSSNGLFSLYESTATPYKLKNLSWSVYPNRYLFYIHSTPTVDRYWKFLDPSPKFPTNNDGVSKLVYTAAGGYTSKWNVQEYYSFDLKVEDKNGVVSGATVSLYDKDDNLTFTTTTDTNGVITTQEVLRMHAYYSGGLVALLPNPYRLVISKTGYETYESSVQIEAKTSLVVSLKSVVKIRKTIEGEPFIALSPEVGSSAKLLKL